MVLDREGLDHARMRLSAPANDTRWAVPEDIRLVGGDLTWPRHGPLRPVSVAGTAYGTLDAFVRLAAGDNQDVLRFAQKWGTLDICRHGLPASHVPERVWRSITEVTGVWREVNEATGAINEDVADSYNPCRPAGLRRLREPVEAWRHFAGEAQAILNISASLHQAKRAPIEMWAPLEAMFGVPAAAMLGEQLAEGGAEPPDGTLATRSAAAEVQVRRPRRSTIDEQRMVISRTVQTWLEWGDVAVVFNWTGTATSIEFGSHCLFGALALQLALAVARSQGLAVCMNCGRAYPPLRRPAPGRNSYCDLSDCGSKAAKRDWAQRKAQG